MNLPDPPCPSPKQTNSGHSPHPIPVPRTCQPLGKGHPPPQCHPERRGGRSARVIAGARGPLGAWSLQGPLEFPEAEKRSIRPQQWASGPRLQTLGQSDASSDGSHAGASPSPPRQGKTPEPAGRIYATELLPQGHYVSPACLPGASHQPRGIEMNCLPSPPGPQRGVPETRRAYEAQGYRRGKPPLVRGCWGQPLARCLPVGGRLKCPAELVFLLW